MSQQLQLPFDKRKPRHAVQLTTNELTQEIIAHFRRLGGWAVRINTVGIYDPRMGIFRKSTTQRGTPDLLGVLSGSFFGVEVKKGNDKLSPCQLQVKRAIEDAGGVFLVAKNIQGFREELREKLQTKDRWSR